MAGLPHTVEEDNNNPWMDATKYFPQDYSVVEGAVIKELNMIISGTRLKIVESFDVWFANGVFDKRITHWRYKEQKEDFGMIPIANNVDFYLKAIEEQKENIRNIIKEELGKINKPVEPQKKELTTLEKLNEIQKAKELFALEYDRGYVRLKYYNEKFYLKHRSIFESRYICSKEYLTIEECINKEYERLIK